MFNAITVDVEDYFHATNLESVAPPARWHSITPRIEYSLNKTLDLFTAHAVRGTFFVLGHVARRFKALVRRITDDGHEVASHGYAHRLVYDLSPKAFERDLKKTKYLLEDISGRRVFGYRAPNFSITSRCPWAYKVLIETGHTYDSSLYPVMHNRYGNLTRSLQPELVDVGNGQIAVFPLAVYPFRFLKKDLRIPVAGGAWWRLFPSWYTNFLLNSLIFHAQQPVICYFHPWELDEEQPCFKEIGFQKSLRHYTGLKGFDRRVARFMAKHKFAPIIEIAEEYFPEHFKTKILK